MLAVNSKCPCILYSAHPVRIQLNELHNSIIYRVNQPHNSISCTAFRVIFARSTQTAVHVFILGLQLDSLFSTSNFPNQRQL